MADQSAEINKLSWSFTTATVVLARKTAMGTTRSLQGGNTKYCFAELVRHCL